MWVKIPSTLELVAAIQNKLKEVRKYYRNGSNMIYSIIKHLKKGKSTYLDSKNWLCQPISTHYLPKNNELRKSQTPAGRISSCWAFFAGEGGGTAGRAGLTDFAVVGEGRNLRVSTAGRGHARRGFGHGKRQVVVSPTRPKFVI